FASAFAFASGSFTFAATTGEDEVGAFGVHLVVEGVAGGRHDLFDLHRAIGACLIGHLHGERPGVAVGAVARAVARGAACRTEAGGGRARRAAGRVGGAVAADA